MYISLGKPRNFSSISNGYTRKLNNSFNGLYRNIRIDMTDIGLRIGSKKVISSTILRE